MGIKIDGVPAQNTHVASIRSRNGNGDIEECVINPSVEAEEDSTGYGLFSTNSDYETNTKKNLFLKEYLDKKALKAGVEIPEGMGINISSYKFEDKYRDILRSLQRRKYWKDAGNWWTLQSSKNKSLEQYIDEYCKTNRLTDDDKKKIMSLYMFNYVRTEIFGARIADMFKLLAKDGSDVADAVEQMDISESDKTKILELKSFFDKYYKIEAEYEGTRFDLLHLSDKDKAELANISPEFAEFLENEQQDLLKQTVHFAQQETKAEELSDAGNSSRWASGILLAILSGMMVYKGINDSKQLKTVMKQSQKFMDFVKSNPEGKNILAKCVTKYNKLGEEKGLEVVGRYMKKIGYEGGEHFVQQQAVYNGGRKFFVNPIKAFKHAKGAALVSLLLTTAAGSLDDCMGAAKDYVQDENNFGSGTALAIGTASIAGGIATSALIAPSVEGLVAFQRAEKNLIKNGFLQSAKGIGKFSKFGKTAALGALFGMIIASSSSGSSWTSMAGTWLKMKQNGSKLADKKIIPEDKGTSENMMEYEAYKGKWSGITKGDWSIGAAGGALGLFTHTNPWVQSFSFGLQGCSETLTACGYQLLGNKARESSIEKEKKDLTASAE